jgi:uncharacterized lipoprotein YmbA
MNRHRWGGVIIVILMLVVWGGCRSVTPSVNYYVMTAVAQPAATDARSLEGGGASVGLRTVEVPGYANRLQLVRRSGANRLTIADTHRWADYPDRMVQRVIGENLQMLMATTRVYSAPWPAGLKPDRVVDISILDMIATDEPVMILTAAWTIGDGRDPSAVHSHRTTETVTPAGSGFSDLAAAHDRALARLCRAVVDSLVDE